MSPVLEPLSPVKALTPANGVSLSRRSATALLATLMGAGLSAVLPAFAQSSEDNVLDEDAVLRDPDIPVAGNPKGDITIVEYFDFQCPFCRKVHPELQKVVREDGHIRLVSKDWPVFGGVSIYAARLALASKYQNKFVEAHNALIEAKTELTEDRVRQLLAAAGIDVDAAVRDMAAHEQEIETILARNGAQAEAFGFRGTPAFIIGKFRVPGGLDAARFKLAIANAREAAKSK